jgi:hypothetical protein
MPLPREETTPPVMKMNRVMGPQYGSPGTPRASAAAPQLPKKIY